MKTVKNKSEHYDLLFIGSGISTSFTILNLLDQLESIENPKSLKLAIVEKNPEFHAGIPYGNRSTTSCLLITSLVDFLPQPELGKFIVWLNENKEWLLESFREDGGALSHEWLEKHKDELKENKWEHLFIPRRFFGWYIKEKVTGKIQQAVDSGYLTVDYFNSSVENVIKENSHYEVLGDVESWKASKIVLAIGSPPPKIITKTIDDDLKDTHFLQISDPYGTGLDQTLIRIQEFLNNRNNKANVLIVGANASALELLYKLNDVIEIKNKIDRHYFISTLGIIPDHKEIGEKTKTFKAENLLALKSERSLTAKQIGDAAFVDLDESENQKIGAGTTVSIISKAFGDLLHLLNERELENFACQYGNEIGRRQRCAGEHYINTIKVLESKGKFQHLKGRFIEMLKKNDDNYHLKYLSTATGEEIEHEDDINILINCIGSQNLLSNDIPLLYKNLIAAKICNPNKSNIGFVVNQDLEASENFHVVGPLLAGNVLHGSPLWHLEHCGRIIWSSRLLSNKLINHFKG